MSTKYLRPEFRADADYILDYNHPIDDTMGGATESFRSDEWQLEQVSMGGDNRINNVRGRILTMFGLFSTTTPRIDASVNRGDWDLASAYKHIFEGPRCGNGNRLVCCKDGRRSSSRSRLGD